MLDCALQFLYKCNQIARPILVYTKISFKKNLYLFGFISLKNKILKTLLGISALLGGLGVVLGALGAHALKNILTAEQLASFKTGVLYQILHVLAIMGVYALPVPAEKKQTVIILFLGGILLFSGSIYILTMTSVRAKWLVLLTPLGGITVIAGWILLAYYIFLT